MLLLIPRPWIFSSAFDNWLEDPFRRWLVEFDDKDASSEVICKNDKVFSAQCGNFKIFLSLRFYVKSKLMNLKSQNLPFFICKGSEFWFCEFLHFLKGEIYQNDQTAVLEFLDSEKLISRKVWITEKSWNFHTVKEKFWNLQKNYLCHHWSTGLVDRGRGWQVWGWGCPWAMVWRLTVGIGWPNWN